MNQGMGYNWNTTSQWSQLPTVPANNDAGANQSNQNNSQVSANSSQVPTENRRDMITRLYKTILGREPDTQGLNYYLFNINISEHQIAKDMYESVDHQDALSKARDIRQMLIKYDEMSQKVSGLELRLQNAESIAENYRLLLEQKTQTIQQLMSGNAQNEASSVSYQDFSSQQPQTTYDQTPSSDFIQQTTSYTDSQNGEPQLILNDPFAEDATTKKGKGCFGMIKKWFSFE